jgi:hypothetical protein
MEETVHSSHPGPKRSALTSILMASLLGTGSLTLVQCTMVGDRLTGLQLNSQASVGCLQDCNEQYAGLFKAEQKRHMFAMEACQSLGSGDEKNDCIAEESDLHQTNMRNLIRGKADCQDSCHHQGVGNGG